MPEIKDFCALYVDTDLSKTILIRLISTVLNGSIDRNTIDTAPAQIYVDDNDEFDNERNQEFPDGFLFFKYRLEISLRSSLAESVSLVGTLLEEFWHRGFRAVAACDFEKMLPHGGGYSWEGNKR